MFSSVVPRWFTLWAVLDSAPMIWYGDSIYFVFAVLNKAALLWQSTKMLLNPLYKNALSSTPSRMWAVLVTFSTHFLLSSIFITAVHIKRIRECYSKRTSLMQKFRCACRLLYAVTENQFSPQEAMDTSDMDTEKSSSFAEWTDECSLPYFILALLLLLCCGVVPS